MKRLLLLLLLALPFTLTAQMRFIATNGKDIRLKHATKAAENKIIIYMEEREVPEHAERIGVLIGNYKRRDKAFEAAKSFAAQAKGHAIRLVDANDMRAGDKALNAMLGTNIKGSYNFYVYKLKSAWQLEEESVEEKLE